MAVSRSDVDRLVLENVTRMFNDGLHLKRQRAEKQQKEREKWERSEQERRFTERREAEREVQRLQREYEQHRQRLHEVMTNTVLHSQVDRHTHSRLLSSCTVGNESVPTQLAQCCFPRLATSSGKM